MAHLVSPSILSADFGKLAEDIIMLNESKADWIHVDIMDGVFVPNISFGFPIMQVLKKYSKKPLDVHLMIQNPDRYIEDFKNYGADILTVHYEGAVHLHRTIEHIKQSGMMAGLAINPHTNIEILADIIPYLDLVLLMSVNPGFGGQKFLEETYLRLSRLRALVDKINPNCKIEIDGGVNADNAPKLIAKGADILVAGSFVFISDNPKSTIEKLKKAK